jgi:hypothetical protein
MSFSRDSSERDLPCIAITALRKDWEVFEDRKIVLVVAVAERGGS